MLSNNSKQYLPGKPHHIRYDNQRHHDPQTPDNNRDKGKRLPCSELGLVSGVEDTEKQMIENTIILNFIEYSLIIDFDQKVALAI